MRATAGHSLGEFSAYHVAASLSLSDAARLVRRRGELMLKSGTERPGTMAAILSDPNFPIDDVCAARENSAQMRTSLAAFELDGVRVALRSSCMSVSSRTAFVNES